MSNLHEIYAELLARGMPPHPRLGFDHNQKGHPYLPTGASWTSDMPQELWLEDSDARDLLEAHALRWFLKWARGMVADHELIAIGIWTTFALTTIKLGIDGDGSVCSGESDVDCDILSCILAATKKPDAKEKA